MNLEENILMDILSSREFGDVTRKAVNKTESSGYETQFAICKHFTQDRLVYTPNLVIGDYNKASWKAGFSRSKEKFLKKFPEKRFLNYLNILKNQYFKEFLEQNKSERIEIPISSYIPKELTWNYNFKKKKENADEFYPLVSFHTHPNNLLIPSKGDLRVLNRYTNMSGDINPILAIAPGKNFNYTPVLLIQQQKSLEREELEEILNSETLNIKNPLSIPQEALDKLFLLKYKKENLEKKGYSIAYLYIDNDNLKRKRRKGIVDLGDRVINGFPNVKNMEILVH